MRINPRPGRWPKFASRIDQIHMIATRKNLCINMPKMLRILQIIERVRKRNLGVLRTVHNKAGHLNSGLIKRRRTHEQIGRCILAKIHFCGIIALALVLHTGSVGNGRKRNHHIKIVCRKKHKTAANRMAKRHKLRVRIASANSCNGTANV